MDEQNAKDNSEESFQNDEIYVKSLVNRIDEMLAESTHKDSYKDDSNWMSSSLNEPDRDISSRPKSTGYLMTSNRYNTSNLMSSDLHDVGNFSNDTCVSPYESILAKLKLEQLRLEESSLLKRKEIMETEMNRPPKSKWYESKGIDFHIESRQNSSRLSKSMDSYRTNNSTLLAYSQDFI